MPAVVKINAYQNEDFTPSFVWSQKDSLGNTVPYNLTGALLTMEIRNNKGFSFFCTIANGRIIVTDAVSGAFTFRILRDDLFTWIPGEYDCDLVYEKDGNTITIFTGKFQLQRGITRLP